MSNFDKVKEIIVSTLGCDEAQVTPEASIADDLGADSLAMVELVMALEDGFEISVPEEESKGIKTVGDIIAMLESKV